jgi:hypothetical protein
MQKEWKAAAGEALCAIKKNLPKEREAGWSAK